jgi:hypothetical protein
MVCRRKMLEPDNKRAYGKLLSSKCTLGPTWTITYVCGVHCTQYLHAAKITVYTGGTFYDFRLLGVDHHKSRTGLINFKIIVFPYI